MTDQTNNPTLQYQSLFDIINTIENKNLLIPVLQSRYNWNPRETVRLLNKIVSGEGIGSFIFTEPQFEISAQEFDTFDYENNHSKKCLKAADDKRMHTISVEQLTENVANNEKILLVLDGVQRLTALYRAIIGVDKIWVELRDTKSGDGNLTVHSISPPDCQLKFMLKPSSDYPCMLLSDIYKNICSNNRKLNGKNNIPSNILNNQTLFDSVSDIFSNSNLISYSLRNMSMREYVLFITKKEANSGKNKLGKVGRFVYGVIRTITNGIFGV